MPLSWRVVPEEEWVFDPSVQGPRRKALLDGRGYDRIVSELLESLAVETIQYLPLRKGDLEKRAVVKLRARPEAIDQFHNSSCGYRAQYYTSQELGERANRAAVEALSRACLSVVGSTAISSIPSSLLAKSLSQPATKTWIHQGSWLISARREARVLHVHRWQLALNSSDKHLRKLARWASLAPSNESGLILKGGFLSPAGEPILGIGKPAGNRSSTLHLTGFT